MTETPDHPTAAIPTTPPPAPPPLGRGRPGRLHQIRAWVGIVAGVVFIVAVVFFSGFFIGKHAGDGPGHRGAHQRGVHLFHQGGPPMGPLAPWRGPGPQMGPGPMGPPSPGAPTPPTTTPSPRP